MALITFANIAGRGGLIRSMTAQADTGQTDHVEVPGWARYAYVVMNVTAVAGTTPTLLLTPKTTALVNPLDTTNNIGLMNLGSSGTQTGTGVTQMYVGAGVTGTTNATAMGASGGLLTYNCVLPPVLSILLTLDRTTGDETYTYTLSCWFYPGA